MRSGSGLLESLSVEDSGAGRMPAGGEWPALAGMGEGEFRVLIRAWLEANLSGPFASLRGAGGPGREHEAFGARLAWDQHLAAAGWTALNWPAASGGRDATLGQQMIFHEEYARAAAPARVSHMGEQLLGPTLIAYGTPEQRQRFLPPIAAVRELWCQGFSEPGAGSDLASVATTGRLDRGEWKIRGQKVWTSLAHVADWIFVLARTTPGSRRGDGLSMLLVPMRQPGITVRPIRQLTGTSEFNEVFFDDARTSADLVLGPPGEGWAVARYLLGVERGAATFGQQIQFRREFDEVVARARQAGAVNDPVIRDRIARACELDDWQRLFLFSRADTIYGGSEEIQLGIIASRGLGLPREPAQARADA